MADTILVIDFGGQYTHLIARRIRELGVFSTISLPGESIPDNVKGIILSGGPRSVYEKDAPKIKEEIFEKGLGVLGICYGHQLMASILGGEVKKGGKKEYGRCNIEILCPEGVLTGLDKEEQVWMSHGDTVTKPPQGFRVLAKTKNCEVAVMGKEKLFGLQFHPEVWHTKKGMKMLSNFVFNICRCKAEWNPKDLIEKSTREIKEKVGDGRAILGLSGGVDSGAVAMLGAKALGQKLVAVYVDTGLMRKGETESVKKAFANTGLTLKVVDAKQTFYERLRGVRAPEEKRKIIGEVFAKVFEEAAKEANADFLLQGTIYPDRIESGATAHAHTIKTHHNVGGLPKNLKFKEVIEPLKELYKDEVRAVAKKLGLPKEIVGRQPFPGPGLGVRILGEVTKEKVKKLQDADQIVREEIEALGLKNRLWQYFAVLLDSKSVGVQGDMRTFGEIIAIRACESSDAMTANFARLDWELLEKISSRITNEVKEVNRVVYDITNKPPSTIEFI